jgi:hypothetical protein
LCGGRAAQVTDWGRPAAAWAPLRQAASALARWLRQPLPPLAELSPALANLRDTGLPMPGGCEGGGAEELAGAERGVPLGASKDGAAWLGGGWAPAGAGEVTIAGAAPGVVAFATKTRPKRLELMGRCAGHGLDGVRPGPARWRRARATASTPAAACDPHLTSVLPVRCAGAAAATAGATPFSSRAGRTCAPTSGSCRRAFRFPPPLPTSHLPPPPSTAAWQTAPPRPRIPTAARWVAVPDVPLPRRPRSPAASARHALAAGRRPGRQRARPGRVRAAIQVGAFRRGGWDGARGLCSPAQQALMPMTRDAGCAGPPLKCSCARATRFCWPRLSLAQRDTAGRARGLGAVGAGHALSLRGVPRLAGWAARRRQQHPARHARPRLPHCSPQRALRPR